MTNKRNYSDNVEIRGRLEEMRREEPMKFFFLMIKKEIQYLFRKLNK